MTFKHIENLLFIAAASFTIAATVRWRCAAVAVAPPAAPVVSIVRRGVAASDDALRDAEFLVVDNDPFRLSNNPPAIRYDPATDGAVAGNIAPAPAPRPSLVLKAIVGGPPWQAIIDGIPGRTPGTVAEQGAVYDKLMVRAVTRDSVIIQGPDTAWVLSFRKPS